MKGVLVAAVAVSCASSTAASGWSRIQSRTTSCSNATTASECGTAGGTFCAYACEWNQSACVNVWDRYPRPSNDSLVKLAGASTPLTADNLVIFFYGDSITWLDAFEPVIASALAQGPTTSKLNTKLVNQGINGGTVLDLVAGVSPWGRLDSMFPQHNLTFNESLHGWSAAGTPDIAAVQIGINDVWQADRGSNLSTFSTVLKEQILAPMLQANIRPYLVTVSVIGEQRDGENQHDTELDAFAQAQVAIGKAMGIPVVNVRQEYQQYDATNNCLDTDKGVLTGDGVHPTDAGGRGAALLANAHAAGLLEVLTTGPPIPSKPPAPPPRPPPLPSPPPGLAYGGRLFWSNATIPLGGGIAGADQVCTAENGGAAAKALLVDESGCAGQPCRRATLTARGGIGLGDGQIDWPLRPNAVYYAADNKTAIAYTQSNGLFHLPIFWYIDPTVPCFNQASGMASDWTTRVGLTCDSWRGGPNATQQGVGWTCSTNGGMLDGGSLGCNPNRVLCAALNSA